MKATLSTASLTESVHFSGRKIGPLCGTMGKIEVIAEFSQGPSGTSRDPNIDYQNRSFMQSSIGTNFPFSFGQTAADFILLGRLHLLPLQMCLCAWRLTYCPSIIRS